MVDSQEYYKLLKQVDEFVVKNKMTVREAEKFLDHLKNDLLAGQLCGGLKPSNN